MNKKILSIFVMVMALSLLGVSCNKKTTDPTNNGGSTTKEQPLSVAEIAQKIADLGAITVNATAISEDGSGDGQKFDFSTVTADTGTHTITGVKPTASLASVKAQPLVDDITTKLQAQGLTVTVKVSVPASSGDPLVLEIKSVKELIDAIEDKHLEALANFVKEEEKRLNN